MTFARGSIVFGNEDFQKIPVGILIGGDPGFAQLRDKPALHGAKGPFSSPSCFRTIGDDEFDSNLDQTIL